MRNLTKIFMVVVLAALGFQSFAQLSLSAKAGVNMATFTNVDDSKMLLAFNLGATVDYQLADRFSFETGLLLSGKGTKIESSSNQGGIEVKATGKFNPIYLEIPLNGKYHFNLGSTKMYLTAGPYVAFGVAGKVKFELEGGLIPLDISRDIEWGSDDDDDLKRMDFGLNFGTGAEFGKIGVGLQYGLGLSELGEVNQGNDKSAKNSVISLFVAYKFL